MDDAKPTTNRGNAGKGRRKGSVNKVTGEVKEMVLTALGKAGGADYLLRQSEENPVAFLTLVGKVLPLQVNAKHDGDFRHEVIRRIVDDRK